VATASFLYQLDQIIAQRLADRPEDSYTARLAARGLSKVAQKVGEEAVEVALAAVSETESRLTEEAADLLFHLMLLLQLKGLTLNDVIAVLESRHKAEG